MKSILSVLALAVALVAAVPAKDTADVVASTLEKRITHSGKVRVEETRCTFLWLYADLNSMSRLLGSMSAKVCVL